MSLEMIVLTSINKVSLVKIPSCIIILDVPRLAIKSNSYWTSRKDSLELVEPSNSNRVSLGFFS
jgi:hypothetical protein